MNTLLGIAQVVAPVAAGIVLCAVTAFVIWLAWDLTVGPTGRAAAALAREGRRRGA